MPLLWPHDLIVPTSPPINPAVIPRMSGVIQMTFSA
jgi:hypothetical protein